MYESLSVTLTLVSDAAPCAPCFPRLGYQRTLSAVALFGLNDPVCHEPVATVNDRDSILLVKNNIFHIVCQHLFVHFHKLFTNRYCTPVNRRWMICSAFFASQRALRHCSRKKRLHKPPIFDLVCSATIN